MYENFWYRNRVYLEGSVLSTDLLAIVATNIFMSRPGEAQGQAQIYRGVPNNRTSQVGEREFDTDRFIACKNFAIQGSYSLVHITTGAA